MVHGGLGGEHGGEPGAGQLGGRGQQPLLRPGPGHTQHPGVGALGLDVYLRLLSILIIAALSVMTTYRTNFVSIWS